MSKEVLHILLSAKLAIGALVAAVPTTASAAPPPVRGAEVKAYEVFDAQPPAIPEFGEAGNGQGGGNRACC